MSRVSTRAAPGLVESLILAAPRRDAAIAVAVAALTAALFAVAADRGLLSYIQSVDNSAPTGYLMP